MGATCVVGLQWGDEAKGKIVDILTEKHDIVVRYQGGANAGHTVVFDGKKYKLSLIPSGIFRPNVQCVVAGGVVLNPQNFIQEMDGLIAQGIDCQNLLISTRAHIIMPWHFEEDRLMNRTTSGENIGTTMRGIGPCYRDKVGRSWAIRLGDLYREEFPQRVKMICETKNRLLFGMDPEGGENRLDAEKITADYLLYADRLRPMATDTTAYLLDALDSGKKILCEGAQGALLDIDHGTFPYVTSSNSSGVGVCSGAGLPAKSIEKLVGIIKAYTTRVGGGPFPTEQDNEIGQLIRDEGNEYGTVTRRPRRCGWFDAVAARYTARLSGATCLSVMLLDVLSKLPEIQICTEYELNGERTSHFPAHVDDLRLVKPHYITLPGWLEDITKAQSWDDLPTNAQNYVRKIGEIIGVPVEIVSVGPDRKQTIFVK
ncbi:MAG: adenylosuccinate synthase [Planctomycetia bacterium]|nr:adenylosuccinate synthase [Planctomycetia bacterium]